MATILVVYRWISRPSSMRRGWVIFNHVREEERLTLMFRMIHAPPPSNFGEPEQERRRVSSFLQVVLRSVRAATHDFTEVPGGDFNRYGDQLAFNVLAAELMVMQSMPTPGTSAQHETTCLLCESPVAESMPRRRNPTRGRILLQRRHILSSCRFWTLLEISIYRSWRDDDDENSPPRLCAFHASELSGALEAVLSAFAVPPVLTPEHRHSI